MAGDEWLAWKARLEGPPGYGSWRSMHDRCGNPGHVSFHDYGGRGICVCDRWFSYAAFIADMGVPPSAGHSIDRFPNKNGHYEPGNCRWATRQEQRLNRRADLPRFFRRWDFESQVRALLQRFAERRAARC